MRLVMKPNVGRGGAVHQIMAGPAGSESPLLRVALGVKRSALGTGGGSCARAVGTMPRFLFAFLAGAVESLRHAFERKSVG